MSKTIVVEKDVWEKLWELKRKWGKRSLNAVIKELIEKTI
jgi:Uncharacterized ACR, COG1753.